MEAWIFVISSSLVKTLTPSGGLAVNDCSSFATCLIICGERFSTFDEVWNRKIWLRIITKKDKKNPLLTVAISMRLHSKDILKHNNTNESLKLQRKETQRNEFASRLWSMAAAATNQITAKTEVLVPVPRNLIGTPHAARYELKKDIQVIKLK